MLILLKHKLFNRSVVVAFISIFTVSMTALLFCQAYPESFESSYDYLSLGDSYAAGQTPYEVMVGYSYSDFIKDKLKAAGILGNYHKEGVSGYETTDVLHQLKSMKKLLYQAELVTLDVGINDILHLTKVEAYLTNPSDSNYDAAQAAVIKKIPEIQSNLADIISEIKGANPYLDPKIYVMGYFDAYPDQHEIRPLIERLNTAISTIAADAGVTYIGTMEAMDKKIKEYLPGDIHPTVEGYGAIAEVFWTAISADFETNAAKLPYDVDGHWAVKDINKYLEKGIINGFPDGSFKPDRAVTRAEFITIINQYFNLTATAEIDFSDVPASVWYRAEIQKAVKAGYIAGSDNGSFRANESVTRQEASEMVAKLMRFDFSADSVNALVRNGILKGYPDNSIRPQEKLTRAELLAVLDNITAYIDRKAPN